MTLAELMASFRSDADDMVAPFLFKDAEIIGWLNEAVDEACIRARLIFDATTPVVCSIAVTPGVSVYPLHEAIHEITYATLVDGTELVELGRTDRLELTRLDPQWRARTGRPKAMIHYDTSVELDSKPTVSYALQLEVYRLPLEPMVASVTTGKPPIASIHHRQLVNWALHRGYSKPDSEVFNPDKAKIAEQAFIAVFGHRPDADLRKSVQANRPQFNKAW